TPDPPHEDGTQGASKPRRRVVSMLTAVDPLLVAIFAAGFAFAAYFTSQVTQWVVMSDELQYSKLALHIGQTLSPIPVIRGEYTGSLSQLYPILTAPFYALWSMPTAFELVHWANAAIMASTCIPAYLLARDVTGNRWAARLVALLTITVPWMAMGTMVLTEVAAYPAFVWSAWAMYRAIAAPSLGRDVVALAGLALAFLARTQFLLLAIVFPLAILAHEAGFAAAESEPGRRRAALWGGVRAAVARHRELATAYAVGALIAIPLALAGVLGRVLGRYETTIHEGGLIPAGLADSMARHLDFVAVAIGVLPFVLAAAWAFGSLVRPTGRRGHAFAVLSLLAVVAVTFQASSFNLRFALGGPIQDRYLFYIVPLLFVGMAACLLDPRRRWKAVLISGAAFTWMVSLANFNPIGLPFFASPDTVFHHVLEGRSYELGKLFGFKNLDPGTVITIASGLLAIGAVYLVRRFRPTTSLAVVGVVVFGFCLVETWYVMHKITEAIVHSAAATALAKSDEGRNWVDNNLPDGETAGVVPSPVNSNRWGRVEWFGPGATEAVWLDTEFWNKSIDQAYFYRRFGGYAPFYTSNIALDRATGRLDVKDAERYWVVAASDVRFRADARIVKESASGLDLIEPRRPYRAAWATTGLAEDGWSYAGRPVKMRLYPAAGGKAVERRVAIKIQSSDEIPRRRAYTLRAGGTVRRDVIRRGDSRVERFTTCVSPNRPSDVSLDIDGRTKLPGRRAVGLRV
ncbi:MAG TPA: glycosyltransferase family 39 protein, partial [Gaiellales bacterium]|nr:glycosyltransferase family 39 protein [Gaiellales bacterium]